MVIKQKLYIDLIYSEIDLTLSSLETLAKVFDHPSCSLTHTKAQVQYKPCSMLSEEELNVISKMVTQYWGIKTHPYTSTHCDFCLVFLEQGPRDGDRQSVV